MSVAEFRDDNRAYLSWVSAHPDGFVINIQRSLNPSDARLHQADCHWIRGRPPRGDGFVGAYIKVCSTSLPDLRDWVRSHIGSPVRDCGTCLPAARGHHPGFPVPATSAKHQASVAGADPWHEFEGPQDGIREVRLWADRYIPFEHLNGPQIAARTELRRRIALLSARPGEMLHASYAGPKPADMDVENLLLYNVGGECFRPAARYGVRFELAASHRDAPSGRALGCSYRYRMIEHEEDLAAWRQKRLLSRFASADLGGFPAGKRVEQVWRAVHRSAIEKTGSNITAAEFPFGVFLTLWPPEGSAAWPSPELVKPLIDGVVAAFQAHGDRATVGDVAALIAATGEPPVLIARTLLSQQHSVLGRVPHLVRPWGKGVQWNPSDHMCVVGEVSVHEGTRQHWALDGEIWALSSHSGDSVRSQQ